MSIKEVKRATVLQDYKSGAIKLIEAAELLELSYPQTKRIWAKFKSEGPQGLISKKRGRKSNRAVSTERQAEIIKIIREKYEGCKPLYISEKMKEKYKMCYSSEFIRQLMIKNNLWISRRKKSNIHQRRARRAREGELIQMDASDHDWFEDRGPRCHLHLLIDDATKKLCGGHFMPEETTEGYFRACLPYFVEKGIPLSFYVDRRGTFKVNRKQGGITQFARAMKELGVKMIFAYSPEAKGRIERAFGTLQERLVWEMRDAQISTIEEANRFLPKFIDHFNEKFSAEPANPSNAHRPLKHKEQIKYILCWKETRTATKNLEISFKNEIYQLMVDKDLRRILKRAKVEVLTTLEGEIRIEFRGQSLNFRRYNEIPYDEHRIVTNVDVPTQINTNRSTPFSRGRRVKKFKTTYMNREEKMTPQERLLTSLRLAKRKLEARRDNLEILGAQRDGTTG